MQSNTIQHRHIPHHTVRTTLIMNYSTKDAISLLTNLTGNYPFLRVNDAYVQITRKNDCAAKILDRLQSWMIWRLKKQGDDWVRLTLEKIWQELQGVHCIETIRSAMNQLINHFGFVERRHNPNAPYDRAYQYRLNAEKVAKAIAALSQEEEAETPAESHFLNDEASSLSLPTIISKNLGDVYEEDPITDSEIDLTTPTTHPVVVEKKSEEETTTTEEVEVSKHPNLNSSPSQNLIDQPKPTPKDQYSATAPVEVLTEVEAAGYKLNADQNSMDEPKPTPKDQYSAIAPAEILTEVQAAGYQLNPNLKKVVLNATLQVVTDALEAVREYLATGKPIRKTREALLVSAIKEEWRPSQSEDPKTPKKAPEGFSKWFSLAKELSIVSHSVSSADGTITVYTPAGETYPWELLRAAHPLEQLRSLFELKSQRVREELKRQLHEY